MKEIQSLAEHMPFVSAFCSGFIIGMSLIVCVGFLLLKLIDMEHMDGQ